MGVVGGYRAVLVVGIKGYIWASIGSGAYWPLKASCARPGLISLCDCKKHENRASEVGEYFWRQGYRSAIRYCKNDFDTQQVVVATSTSDTPRWHSQSYVYLNSDLCIKGPTCH